MIVNFLLALLGLYALLILSLKLGLKYLSCQRSFSRSAVFEGQEGELVEVVRNDTPFIIPWLRVESNISRHLQLGRQENLQVSGKSYYCSFFTLMPFQQIRRRHRVRFLHRGFYDLGNAALGAGDVLGVVEYQKQQKLYTPVLVYPRLLEEDQVSLPISRLLGELTRRRQLLTDPFLTRGIRPYMPGDPVRDIHWAATARTGETQVRVHDYSARTRLLVVMNVQYQDIQLSNYIPDEQSEPVEQIIRLAATACIQALRNNLAAGFAANMPQGEGKESTVLLPEDGLAHQERILSDMARLNLSCTEKFPTFLDSLTNLTGLDMLVLSRYDSESIQSSLQRLRQAGNQVTLYVTEGGSAHGC